MKFEITSKLPLPKDVSDEDIKRLGKLRLCVKMIEQKNGIHAVKGYFNSEDKENVTISLFNGRHGVDEDKVDEENESVLDLLKTFGPKISKKEDAHSFWSQTVVQLPFEKLNNIIEALSVLEDKIVPEGSKLIARC